MASPAKGKARVKIYKDPKTGRTRKTSYGQAGHCARSYGQMKSHPSAAKNPNSALRLSRKRWRCVGKRSTK